jgi:hypothetical protein
VTLLASNEPREGQRTGVGCRKFGVKVVVVRGRCLRVKRVSREVETERWIGKPEYKIDCNYSKNRNQHIGRDKGRTEIVKEEGIYKSTETESKEATSGRLEDNKVSFKEWIDESSGGIRSSSFLLFLLF